MKTLWQVSGASVIGSTHIRKGTPNQDAYGYKNLGGDIQVLALSDGHGGEKHLYSDIGSKAAVEAAIECVEDYVRACMRPELHTGTKSTLNTTMNSDSDSISHNPAKLRYDFEGQVSMAIQARWLQKIQVLSVFEDAIQFGCTLLLTVKFDDILVFLQIGDGKIAVVYTDGVIYYPVPRDERYENNETASLAQPQAWAEMKVVTMTMDYEIHTIVLASDGVENAYPQDYYDDAYFYLNLALTHNSKDSLSDEISHEPTDARSVDASEELSDQPDDVNDGPLIKWLNKAQHYSKDDTTAIMWRNPDNAIQMSDFPESLTIWMGNYPNSWIPIACYLESTLNKRIDYTLLLIEAIRRSDGYVPEHLSLKQIYLDPETLRLEYFADGKSRPVDAHSLHDLITQMLMLPDSSDFLPVIADLERILQNSVTTKFTIRQLKKWLISLKRCMRYDYQKEKFVCDDKDSAISLTASNGNFAIYYNSDLYLHQIMPLVGDYDCLVGRIIQHAKHKNIWGMVNLTQHAWQVSGGNGKQNVIEPGMTLTLLDGITVFVHGIPVKIRILNQLIAIL